MAAKQKLWNHGALAFLKKNNNNNKKKNYSSATSKTLDGDNKSGKHSFIYFSLVTQHWHACYIYCYISTVICVN